MLKPHIYVAGPITKGDRLNNLKVGCVVANELLNQGFIPFVPHTHELFHMLGSHDYERILAFDMAWLERCDCIIRIPGESEGADRELRRAKRLGIPVLGTPDDMREFKREWRKKHGNAQGKVGFVGATPQRREGDNDKKGF